MTHQDELDVLLQAVGACETIGRVGNKLYSMYRAQLDGVLLGRGTPAAKEALVRMLQQELIELLKPLFPLNVDGQGVLISQPDPHT